MLFRKTLYLTTFLFFPFLVTAQNTEIDSLKSTITINTSDSVKIDLYLKIAQLYNQTNPDSTEHYALLAKDLSEQIEHPYYSAYSWNIVAAAYLRIGSYGRGLSALQEAQKYAELLSDEHITLKAQILRSLGNIYFIQYKYEEALLFYNESLELFEKDNNIAGIGFIYNNFANVYYETFKFDSALMYYKRYLDIETSKGNEQGMASAYLNMGMLYQEMDSMDLAIEYSLKAKAIAEKYNALVMLTYPLKVLSTVSREKGEYEEAIQYATQSLEIANDLGIIYEQKDAHQNLAESYEGIGNYRLAFDHYKTFKQLNDSLLNEDSNNKLAEMRAKYESEKKEQEILVLEAENRFHKTRNLVITLVAGIILLILASALILYASRKRKELQLLEKDRELAESKKKLAEEELQNSKLREENLQKELTNYALHIVEKNDFLDEVKSEVAQIKNQIQNHEAISHINKLGSKIFQNLMINKDREEFDIQVEQACEGFFKNLEQKFPDLTSQERRLSALLRLNLSSKEISGIMNISPKSVDQGRYRLRKKLAINTQKNLSVFLNQI